MKPVLQHVSDVHVAVANKNKSLHKISFPRELQKYIHILYIYVNYKGM